MYYLSKSQYSERPIYAHIAALRFSHLMTYLDSNKPDLGKELYDKDMLEELLVFLEQINRPDFAVYLMQTDIIPEDTVERILGTHGFLSRAIIRKKNTSPESFTPRNIAIIDRFMQRK